MSRHIQRPGVLMLLAAMTACVAPEPPVQRHYALRGEIVGSDPDRGTVTVAHEEIAGFMSAMTMPFTVRDDWVFEAADPGARIQATLVVDDTSSWLQDIVINRPAAAGHAMQAVISMPESGEVVLRTLIVDPEGAVVRVLVGNTWEVRELLSELEAAVAGNGS